MKIRARAIPGSDSPFSVIDEEPDETRRNFLGCDGRVVITPLDFLLDEAEQDHPPQLVITIAEARKLILDWLAAEKAWYAEREARRVEGQQIAVAPKA